METNQLTPRKFTLSIQATSVIEGETLKGMEDLYEKGLSIQQLQAIINKGLLDICGQNPLIDPDSMQPNLEGEYNHTYKATVHLEMSDGETIIVAKEQFPLEA